ncbi:MAG: hypothetical protein RLZZ182_2687 [Pseudomonadota bacterium]|jgi:hypothetical protein
MKGTAKGCEMSDSTTGTEAMTPRYRRLQALEAAQKPQPQEAPPSPVVLYSPGGPLPPVPQGVPVAFYLPENGR